MYVTVSIYTYMYIYIIYLQLFIYIYNIYNYIQVCNSNRHFGIYQWFKVIEPQSLAADCSQHQTKASQVGLPSSVSKQLT